MTLGDFISKQFIRVIQWSESEDDVLQVRYPMQDMEIENGGQMTVRKAAEMWRCRPASNANCTGWTAAL